jgi:hypothetical protein
LTVCGHEALGALVGPRGLGGCAPLVVGNTVYLDTGAGCEHGALSLANLDEMTYWQARHCGRRIVVTRDDLRERVIPRPALPDVERKAA